MFKPAVIGQWTAILAIVSAAMTPLTLRAEPLAGQDGAALPALVDDDPDNLVQAATVPSRELRVLGPAAMPAHAHEPDDPERDCRNIMLASDKLCEYAGPARVSRVFLR